MIESFSTFKPLELPGVRELRFRDYFIQDATFFLVVVALPSSFFALIPPSTFYDLKLVFLFISSLYVFYNLIYIKKISRLPGGIPLIILNVFLVFQVWYSLDIKEIPFAEVATIFRANFFYPITALGFLLYIATMENDRIYRFMYWLLAATFLQGFLYILSNLTGINVFSAGGRGYIFQGKEILQNMFAIPHFNAILFSFAFASAITLEGFKKHWAWFVPLIVTIISIVRSQMIVYLLIAVLILFLTIVSKIKINFSKLFKLVLLGLVFTGILLIIFPSHTNRVIKKFGFNDKTQITKNTYLKEGTFYLRLRIIEEAYNRTKNNLGLGNGYKREALKGEYDFVVGSDTLIAPVLYTEGIVGLILRVLPIAILLIYFIKLFFSRDSRYRLFSIIGIALITSAIINAVQTKYFVYYARETFILFVMIMIIYNDERLNKLKK